MNLHPVPISSQCGSPISFPELVFQSTECSEVLWAGWFHRFSPLPAPELTAPSMLPTQVPFFHVLSSQNVLKSLDRWFFISILLHHVESTLLCFYQQE